jgi:hypothetical protein
MKTNTIQLNSYTRGIKPQATGHTLLKGMTFKPGRQVLVNTKTGLVSSRAEFLAR